MKRLFLLPVLVLVLAFAGSAAGSVKDPCPLSFKSHRCVKALPPDPRLFCVGRGTVIVCIDLPRWLVRQGLIRLG